MAETMTALVERNRAHLAAHSAACAQPDWNRETEADFFASADTAAGTTIEADPPRLRDKADLVAAISYVAEDVDFLQPGHGRVLARVLEYLTAPEPAPPASAPTPFALRMAAYRQDCDRYNTSTTDDDEPNPDGVLLADLSAGKVTLAGMSDAVEAMRYVLDEDVIEDVLAEKMTRCVLSLLEGEGPVQGQPAGADAERIGTMMRELRILHDRPPTELEDNFDTSAEFEILRDRILATPPVSPQDVALQLMADTHWGACEVSDGFFEQLAALSGQEAVQ